VWKGSKRGLYPTRPREGRGDYLPLPTQEYCHAADRMR